MTFLATLLLHQTYFPQFPEVEPSPELIQSMDRAFSLPVLSRYRTGFESAKARGFKVRQDRRKLIFEYFDRNDRTRSFFATFNADTFKLTLFSAREDATRGESLSVASLESRLRQAVLQLSPEISRPDIRFEETPFDMTVWARRKAHGRPVSDSINIVANRITGNVVFFGSYLQFDADLYGGSATLETETLRSIAYGYYAQQGFDQAVVHTDELEISLPMPSLRQPLSPKYLDLYRRRAGIPTYRMRWDHELGDYFDVQLDARDGTMIHAFKNGAMGGATQPSPPKAFPDTVRVAKTSGKIQKLQEKSADPRGVKVAVESGPRVFTGLFERGILWLRRVNTEPYQSFRPDPQLRKALEAQVKRNEALARKKP